MIIFNRKIIFAICFFIFVGVGFIILSYLKDYEIYPYNESLTISLKEFEKKVVQKEQCLIKIEERVVRGNSLQGLVEDGQIVKVFLNYYDCHKIQRNDLVLYSFAGRKTPLIKIVRGIPGDKLNLQQTTGGWHILINNKILKNSQDIPYLIFGQGYKMLTLYEDKIPSGAYLILSNLPGGAMDSTRFGLIGREGILGKAIKKIRE
jgi:signal peptidase I